MLTAKQASEIAQKTRTREISDEMVEKHLGKIYKKILKASSIGRYSIEYYIYKNKPKEFNDKIRARLRQIGYYCPIYLCETTFGYYPGIIISW